MRIISIIEDQEPVESLKVERVIDKILRPLGLWQTNQRPPPPSKSLELQLDYSDSQLPVYEEAFDQDFGASVDHSTMERKSRRQKEQLVQSLDFCLS